MSERVQSDATEVCDRVIRFIGCAVRQPGMKTQLVARLRTSYKKLTRFVTLAEGDRPIRDMAFLLEILSALGYNAGEVFDAAELSRNTDEMQLRLRDRRGSGELRAAS